MDTCGDFVSVSRETRDRLEVFVQLLAKWNKAINLVSKATTIQFRSRKFPRTQENGLILVQAAGFRGWLSRLLQPIKRLERM